MRDFARPVTITAQPDLLPNKTLPVFFFTKKEIMSASLKEQYRMRDFARLVTITAQPDLLPNKTLPVSPPKLVPNQMLSFCVCFAVLSAKIKKKDNALQTK